MASSTVEIEGHDVARTAPGYLQAVVEHAGRASVIDQAFAEALACMLAKGE